MKTKICTECGKSFEPRCGTQVYCDGPHFTVCKICGKQIEYTSSPKNKPMYCSKVCRNEGKRRTIQSKYGVNNVSELNWVKDKISKSNSSEEVSSKRKTTCLAKWGVDNISKNLEIKNKLSKVIQSDEYLKSREQTCLNKYGYKSPMMNDDVKKKRENTCLERYGIKGHINDKSYYSKIITDNTKVDKFLSFKSNPKSYILSNYAEIPTAFQLASDLGVTDTPIYDIILQHDCNGLIKHSYSNMEYEVCNYLHELDSNIRIVRNDRTLIRPQEIDIYLPQYKIGIECNPAATHNSSIKDPWGSPPKYYKYHQLKSIASKNANIFLFHIFGYEWMNKQCIIKSMLANLLNKSTMSIGGRETYVCEVPYNECKQFLNDNHRQGFTSSKVRLGLRIKSTDELVCVMTFGHMRNTMGKSSNSSKADWELSRFCTKLYMNVAGGASKLFKYFLNNYKPYKVISFSDRAHTKGNLYQKLKFEQQSVSDPSYIWSDIYDKQYFHRVSCQKQNLKQLLKDDTIDIDHQTEREIMESHKYVRVYDCGVIRWVYTNENEP